MIFSDAEMAEYDLMVQDSDARVQSGQRPTLSALLASLQFGVVLPTNDEGTRLWYQDKDVRNLLVLSVKKLMHEHQPAEFSVPEKALMMAILQIDTILRAKGA